MPTQFSPKAMRFLKGLQRNNDRDWFNERKPIYEAEIQAPWLSLIEEINTAFLDFAPTYVKPPKKAAMRIYRDIRFSPDKRPYKTHVAAWWSTTTTERTSGGGYYAQVGPAGVVIAGGVYMPQPEQLLLIRRHLQSHHGHLRILLDDKKRRKLLPDFDTNPLQRMPKGFPADDAAGDLLLCRQWALSVQLPADLATGPGLLHEIVSRFRALAPVVELLNQPLLSRPARKSLF